MYEVWLVGEFGNVQGLDELFWLTLGGRSLAGWIFHTSKNIMITSMIKQNIQGVDIFTDEWVLVRSITLQKTKKCCLYILLSGQFISQSFHSYTKRKVMQDYMKSYT